MQKCFVFAECIQPTNCHVQPMNSLDHFCTVEHIFMWITTSIIACEMQKTEVEEESVVCHLCRELQLARTKFCVKWTLSRYSTQHIVLLRLSATSCVTDMLGAEWQINDATCSSDNNTPKVHLYHYLLFHTVYMDSDTMLGQSLQITILYVTMNYLVVIWIWAYPLRLHWL